MRLRLGALHDALLEAGASAELARRAAEDVADYEQQMANLRGDLRVLQWMVGFLLALSVGNLWVTVTILGRLPR